MNSHCCHDYVAEKADLKITNLLTGLLPGSMKQSA